jgi:branched-chain amino acid transport system permease protein
MAAMASLIQLIISGLATGAIYALVAVGFMLLWQTSQTINFAQGEFVMVPAFFVLAAMKFGGLSFWPAALVGLAASVVVLGILFKRIVVDPMLRHGVLPLVISTIALSIFLKESVKEFYSSQAQPFPPLVEARDIDILGVQVSAQSLAVLAIAIVTVVALQFMLNGTRLGRAMQATAQNPTVARILGIRVERMILLTFVINGLLVAIASILISPIYLAKFTNGETLGLAAFIAAIVGGFNQVRGAIAGGLLLGVVDNLSAAYVSAQYRGALPLFILIAMILFRPQGLLGRAEERTV